MKWALAALAIIMAALAVGSIWQPHNPHAVDLDAVLAAPSPDHWLGTDHLGRDLVSRLMAGAISSLLAVVVALVASLGIGGLIGALAALGNEPVQHASRRLAELALSVPTMVSALIIAAIFGAGPVTTALALAATAWAPYALVVAALSERLMAEPYWRAAEALGVGRARGMIRHLLPNLAAPLGALVGADAGRAVVLVASLGFLGLSADTGRPEWGAMVYEYRLFLFDTPRLLLAPIFAISVLALMMHLGIEHLTAGGPQGTRWSGRKEQTQ